MVIVPCRLDEPELTCAEYVNVELPELPEPPFVIASHGASLLDAQLVTLLAVTVAVPVCADELRTAGDGASATIARVGVAVAPAAWFTVKVAAVLPCATVMVPVRAGPVFPCTAYVNVVVPFPPDAPALIVSHGWLLAAVQVAFAVICAVPVCWALDTDATGWATATDGAGGSGAPSVTVKLMSNVSGLVPLQVFVGVWPTQASVVLVSGPWYWRAAVQTSAFGSVDVTAVIVPVKIPPLLPPSLMLCALPMLKAVVDSAR